MHELPPKARALLDAAARADDPTATERARADAHVRAALKNKGVRGLPPLAPAQPNAPGGLARLSLRTKLGLLAGSLIGAGGLAAALLQSPARPSLARVSASVGTPELATPAQTQTPHAARASTGPSAPIPSPAPTANPSPKPRSIAPARAKSGRNTASDEALERELRIIASADELIRAHRFGEALRLLGASDSGASMLQEERSALRILAWCGQAPDEHALRARQRFLEAAPQAVLAARVREACQNSAEGAR